MGPEQPVMTGVRTNDGGCMSTRSSSRGQLVWAEVECAPGLPTICRMGNPAAADQAQVADHLNRGSGILSGGVGARPVPACTCRRPLRGDALWGARAKRASRHDCGLAIGLYLNRGAGILSGGVGARPVPVRAVASCTAVYCDEKVANREIRAWHGATGKGP